MRTHEAVPFPDQAAGLKPCRYSFAPLGLAHVPVTYPRLAPLRQAQGRLWAACLRRFAARVFRGSGMKIYTLDARVGPWIRSCHRLMDWTQVANECHAAVFPMGIRICWTKTRKAQAQMVARWSLRMDQRS
jgi:hypothetical protein